jgi:hypothetical protein
VEDQLNAPQVSLAGFRRTSNYIGFRGKADTIPGSIRSAFRNEAGHNYGMNPVTDSDFKPVTCGHPSEP